MPSGNLLQLPYRSSRLRLSCLRRDAKEKAGPEPNVDLGYPSRFIRNLFIIHRRVLIVIQQLKVKGRKGGFYMPDQELCAAGRYTPASKLREEPCDAVGGGRTSKPPSPTAPDTSRLRPAGAV